MIALNQQSLDKFQERVKPGGVLIYDPNGITVPPTREDVSVYSIPATEASAKMGNTRVFNMVVLGALLKIRPIVSLESALKGLKKSLPERLHKTLPANEEAIKLGMELAG